MRHWTLCFFFILSSVSTLFAKTEKITERALADKIYGGWAGKVIGVQTGAPHEFHRLANINDGTVDTMPSDIFGALGQDDIYTQLSFLETFDRYGLDADADVLAEAFSNAGFELFHANLQARKNYLDGLRPPLTGAGLYNSHADDIDFQIDADFIGMMCPLMPRMVRRYCRKIGPIMNDGDGIYGGIFIATMHSLAFLEDDIPSLVRNALRNIPRRSAYRRCIEDVLNQYRRDPDDWRAAWEVLHGKWEAHACTPNHPFNIDAKMNGAYVVTGLLYGHGDLKKTMEIAVRCGQDADCNASNAAAIWGVMNGYDAFPDEYKAELEKIRDRKFDHTSYSWTDAAAKVAEFAGQNIIRGRGKYRDGVWHVRRQPSRFFGRCRSSFGGAAYAESFYCDAPQWTLDGSWESFREFGSDPFVRSSTPGASAELSFEGTMVSLIGAWDPACGMADVYLDGKLVRRVDSWFRYRCGFFIINRQQVFTACGLKPGKHTLRLVVSKERNPESTGNEIIFTRADIYR